MHLILINLNVHVASVYSISATSKQVVYISNWYIRSNVKAEIASIPITATRRAVKLVTQEIGYTTAFRGLVLEWKARLGDNRPGHTFFMLS